MKTPPIPNKLFFKIGEVAELAGIEQHVLRYWEEEIESLNPKKNQSIDYLNLIRSNDWVFNHTHSFSLAFLSSSHINIFLNLLVVIFYYTLQ